VKYDLLPELLDMRVCVYVCVCVCVRECVCVCVRERVCVLNLVRAQKPSLKHAGALCCAKKDNRGSTCSPTLSHTHQINVFAYLALVHACLYTQHCHTHVYMLNSTVCHKDACMNNCHKHVNMNSTVASMLVWTTLSQACLYEQHCHMHVNMNSTVASMLVWTTLSHACLYEQRCYKHVFIWNSTVCHTDVCMNSTVASMLVWTTLSQACLYEQRNNTVTSMLHTQTKQCSTKTTPKQFRALKDCKRSHRCSRHTMNDKLKQLPTAMSLTSCSSAQTL
jgi:hypothetical protein